MSSIPPSNSSLVPDTDDVSTRPVRDFVEDRFSVMQTAANETFQATKQYIASLQELAESFVPPDPGAISNVDNIEIPSIDFSGRPSLGGLTLPNNWPEVKPSMGVLDALPELVEYQFPVKPFPDMEWSLVERPVMDEFDLPAEPPAIADVEDVGSLETPDMPTAPTLRAVTVPDAPVVALPTLDASLVEQYINIPSGFSWESSPYNSEIWNDLLENVITGLREGGTGLGADIEADICSRAQRRQQAENDRRYRDVESGFAARGWDLPPGALVGAMLEISEEIDRNNTDLNGQIAISQAELAQKNTQFTTEQAIRIEQVLREFFNANETRSLESSRSLASNAIDMTNALIARANLENERFSRKLAAYEALLNGSNKALETYRLQLESAKLQSEIRKDDLEIYEKQVMAVELAIKIHSLRIENARLKKEVEQINLQNFEIATKIYLSKMEGNKIKADLYGKEIAAEAAKAQIYAEQNRSWMTEMEALKTKNDLQISNLNAVATKNNQVIEQYKGELSGYQAEIDAASKIVDATVRGFEAEAKAYDAETGALESMYGTKIKEIEAHISRARFQVEQAIAEVNASINGYVAIKQLQLKAIDGPMQVGAQLTASAWNAVNASASMSTNATLSETSNNSKTSNISVTHHYEHPTTI